MDTLLGECSQLSRRTSYGALKRGTLHREGTGLPGQERNILKRPCLVCIAAVVGFSGVNLNVWSEGRNNADSAVRRSGVPELTQGSRVGAFQVLIHPCLHLTM